MIFDAEDRILISEGKLLEVIPLIETGDGSCFMLPPVIWPVSNELMGYRDDHVQGMPIQMWMQERAQIPGSVSSRWHRLGFIVRVMENSPTSMPQPGTMMSTEDVQRILDAATERERRADSEAVSKAEAEAGSGS